MQKQLVFVIIAAVLLAAIGSVALYTVHIANAQSNMTSAGGSKNMRAGSNMTGAAGNATGGSMHTAKPAGYLKHGIIIGLAHPAGANTTAGSNMTGTAGNMTGANTTAAHGKSIPTAKPAGCSFLDPRC
jgi:hypothetical protein